MLWDMFVFWEVSALTAVSLRKKLTLLDCHGWHQCLFWLIKKTVRNVRLKPDLTSEARCSRRGLLKTSRVFTQHQLEHVALLYRSDAHGEKILMKFDLFMLAHHLIQYPIFSECQKEQM